MADLSTDSADITADLIEQTPIEKCSLNPRRGRNSRRLLTGFIIYASEVRKEVVEKYPDQNFGFISKLVGDKWRDLHTDLRFKYHQRALIHNKRIKELAAREGVSLGDIDLANGSVIKAPKVAKKSKKAEKEAKRRANESSNSTTPNPDKSSLSLDTMGMMKMNGISNLSYSNDIGVGGHFQATAVTPAMSKGYSSHPIKYAESHQHVQSAPTRPRKVCTVDSATQTPCIRYIEPPPKKPLKYSEPFLKRLEEIRQQLLIASHVAPVVHNYLSA